MAMSAPSWRLARSKVISVSEFDGLPVLGRGGKNAVAAQRRQRAAQLRLEDHHQRDDQERGEARGSSQLNDRQLEGAATTSVSVRKSTSSPVSTFAPRVPRK